MGLSSSKPFQISLSDSIEKVRCYSVCCRGQVIVEDHCEFESQLIKKVKHIVAKILTLLINSFTMSPTPAPKKDSLDFLSDYYFNTKNTVAFTSPLALYGDAKKRYHSLTFRQVKTLLQSKDTYTLHKPVWYNFPRNR